MKKSKNVKPAKRMGATRKVVAPKKRSFLPGILRGTVLVICVGLIIGGYLYVDISHVKNRVAGSLSRPINQVMVEGEFQFVNKDYVGEIVSSELNKDFVNTDLRVIKSEIEKNPWVQLVRLKRVWPDSLKITLIEHQPIARWGAEGFINSEGKLIVVDIKGMLTNLPKLYAEDAESETLARWYMNAQALMNVHELTISSVEVNTKREWLVELASGVELLLAEQNKQQQLDVFLEFYISKLNRSLDQVAKIDMRYEQAFAVAWKNDKENMVIASE